MPGAFRQRVSRPAPAAWFQRSARSDRQAMPELNQAKKDAFIGKMVEILSAASLALMTSIGRQTGLLEVMAALPPSTRVLKSSAFPKTP